MCLVFCYSLKSTPKIALFLLPGKVHALEEKLSLLLPALGMRTSSARLKRALGQVIRWETSLCGDSLAVGNTAVSPPPSARSAPASLPEPDQAAS